jgi:sphingolipid delta-4 desaturase
MSVTLFQIGMAYFMRNASWTSIFVLGYIISGTCNQNLFCAQHELSHFLALKKPAHNKVLSILSNCPLVVPSATTFRKYHQEHHSHLVMHPPPVPDSKIIFSNQGHTHV